MGCVCSCARGGVFTSANESLCQAWVKRIHLFWLRLFSALKLLPDPPNPPAAARLPWGLSSRMRSLVAEPEGFKNAHALRVAPRTFFFGATPFLTVASAVYSQDTQRNKEIFYHHRTYNDTIPLTNYLFFFNPANIVILGLIFGGYYVYQVYFVRSGSAKPVGQGAVVRNKKKA